MIAEPELQDDSALEPKLEPTPEPMPEIDRPVMEIDIACAGFGPATGGFLTTLTRAWSENPEEACFGE